MGLRWKKDSVKKGREKESEREKFRKQVSELEKRDSEKDIAITELELNDIEKDLAITDLELAVLGLQAAQAQSQVQQEKPQTDALQTDAEREGE